MKYFNLKQVGFLTVLLSIATFASPITADEQDQLTICQEEEQALPETTSPLADAIQGNTSFLMAKTLFAKKGKKKGFCPGCESMDETPFAEWVRFEGQYDNAEFSLMLPFFPIEVVMPDETGINEMLFAQDGEVVYTLTHISLANEDANESFDLVFEEFRDELFMDDEVEIISGNVSIDEENGSNGFADVVVVMEIPISFTQNLEVFSCIRIIKKDNHVFILQTSSMFPEKMQNHENFVDSFEFFLTTEMEDEMEVPEPLVLVTVDFDEEFDFVEPEPVFCE